MLEDNAKNRGIIVFFVLALIVIMAGLIIVILILIKPWESTETKEIIANKDNTSLEATQQRNDRRSAAIEDCNDTRDNYINGDVDYEEAVNIFDETMLGSDPVYNIYFAICYASFLHDNNDDMGGIDILEKVESQLDDVNKQNATDYYVAMRSMYGYVSNDEKVEYYNSKVLSMLDGERLDMEAIRALEALNELEDE